MADFNNKVFVITGAAGGVGSAVTPQVAATGAKLALWDHAQERLDKLAAGLPDGTDYLTIALDLTREDAVDDAVAKTVAHFGQIDHLLHIAGGFAMPGPVHEGYLDKFQFMMNLNATATYITCGKVAKSMLDNGVKGSITAVAAKGAIRGGKNSAVYSASKAAALRILESMADELKSEGIRVNAISPSTIDTPGNRAAMGDANAHKWVTPKEMADTMLFLASDEASGITGANVEIYGRV
ncbi:MAG: SDR family NAD(P)-dependent oxidoreductase [Chloroflexota bacterium]